MPVLPLVASTTSPPGARRPSRSAASIIDAAMRSFTEPPGLKDSTLANTAAPPAGATRPSLTQGVPPIASRIVSSGAAARGRRRSGGSADAVTSPFLDREAYGDAEPAVQA